MEGQSARAATGGSMRLGAYPCRVVPDTLAARAYGKTRGLRAPPPPLEVNPEYHERLRATRARDLGDCHPTDSSSRSSSIPDHPWFLGCQFHPEFQSTPFEPHPLFRAFVGAAVRRRSGGV